jgi:hypothetical protein
MVRKIIMRKSILACLALLLAFAVCAPINVEAQPGRGKGYGNSRYAQRMKERRKINRERAKFVRKVEKERFKSAQRDQRAYQSRTRIADDDYYRDTSTRTYSRDRNGRYSQNDPYYNGPNRNDPYYNGGNSQNDPYYNGSYDPYYDDDYYYDRDRRSFYRRHRNAVNIGIAAGAGAVIGGIVNGKKGALIGAGIGAGAGAIYTYGINPKDKRRPRIYYPY